MPPAFGRVLAPRRTQLARLIRLGLPVFCGGSHGRDVALTFDDGPGPYTRLALRILRKDGARATFFLVGRNIARYARSLPRAELALGAVGDHTWNHLDLPRLDRRTMAKELSSTQEALRGATGLPVRLFRPPYGAHDAAVDDEARKLGMLEVLWSIDSRDSEGAGYLQIAHLVLSVIRPGSIVLMHENRGQTIRALKFFILPALRRSRLRTVSVPALLSSDPPTLPQLRLGYRGCFAAPRKTLAASTTRS
jgi:peptidoglycan/xylan/chitin deacetylase (PgdA/CDA1 family)